MQVTVHQPEHWPWLGFFHKITQADKLVILDSVQYRHKYFQNRNKIKGKNGMLWLNIPIRTKGRRFQKINEVEITNNESWRRKCINSIAIHYRKAPYYDMYMGHIKDLYDKTWHKLIDFNLSAIELVLEFLDCKIPIKRSSELGVVSGTAADIFEICKRLKATSYISGISGIGGRGREGEKYFKRENIKVVYQKFHHPIYRQLYGDFIPCLSVLDLLFNHGPKSLSTIHGNRVPVMEHVFE